MTRRGITAIEIMIIVAITGILLAVAIPNFLLYRARRVGFQNLGTPAP